MNIKACIFDLDGVIVDTAKFHFLAWQKLAKSFDIEFTEHDNEQLKGVSRAESLKYILSLGSISLSEEELLDAARLKNDWYIDLISNLNASDILEGIHPFLDYLKANNIKIGLGSASKNAVPVLKSTGIYPYFDAIADGNSTEKSKPDPAVFLIAAEQLDCKVEECIVFEDAYKGVEAAKNGGFLAVGIGTAEALPNADVVYTNLIDKTLETILVDISNNSLKS